MQSLIVNAHTRARHLFVGLAAILLATITAARADDAPANPTILQFKGGGTISMKLNKGQMEVVGVPGDRISVSWRPRHLGDEGDVRVTLRRTSDDDAALLLDGPGEDIRYRIEVPTQSDVRIRMRAGELDVRGVVGNMDIDLLAGEMNVRVPDPKRYRSVSASVIAGEVTAMPWNADRSGLWRSFKTTGEGDLELRARLIAGELSIRAE